MASSVRRLCLDAPLGRYWRIGLVVRRVWISWMNLRVSGISRVAETRETDSTAFLFIGIPTSRVLTLPAIVIVRLVYAAAPMTRFRQPSLMRSTLHRPVLARSNSLKVVSSLLLANRAC